MAARNSFLEQIVFFVGQPRGGQPGDGRRTALRRDPPDFSGELVESRVPADRLLLDHGFFEALRIVDVTIAEKAADAQIAIVDGPGIVGGNAIDLVLLNMDIHLALAAAVTAHGRGLGQLPGTGSELEGLGDHSAGWAHCDTIAAEGTVFELLVDKGVVPLVIHKQGVRPDNLMTDLDAFFTQDAARRNLLDQGPMINRVGVDVFRRKFLAGHIQIVAGILKIALAAGITHRAVEGMIDQDQLHDLFPGPGQPL